MCPSTFRNGNILKVEKVRNTDGSVSIFIQSDLQVWLVTPFSFCLAILCSCVCCLQTAFETLGFLLLSFFFLLQFFPLLVTDGNFFSFTSTFFQPFFFTNLNFDSLLSPLFLEDSCNFIATSIFLNKRRLICNRLGIQM